MNTGIPPKESEGTRAPSHRFRRLWSVDVPYHSNVWFMFDVCYINTQLVLKLTLLMCQ